jgi:hypothetical protein
MFSACRQRDRSAIQPQDCPTHSSAESLCGASFRFRGLFFSILGRCGRFKRIEKTSRDAGYFIDRTKKRPFVLPLTVC